MALLKDVRGTLVSVFFVVCAAGRKGLDLPPPWLEWCVFCFCRVERVWLGLVCRAWRGVVRALVYSYWLLLSIAFGFYSVLFLLVSDIDQLLHARLRPAESGYLHNIYIL